MSNPPERPAPPHSTILDALVAGQPIPERTPPRPEPAAAVPPPAPPVAEPALPVRSHLASIPTSTAPAAAAVFQPAPGDRRAQLRQSAAERSRRRRASA